MNRIIAFIILIVLSPFLVIIMLVLLCFQGFPVFFIQERVGQGGTPFDIYKFRTMKAGDITTVGRIIRNLGIDEIPQLLNIVKGDMAFIGPRPLTAADIVRLKWDTDYHKIRWTVKPGITGLSQLAPVCHKKVSWFCDLYYSRNKTIFLDISVILQTILVLFIGKQRLKKLKKK